MTPLPADGPGRFAGSREIGCKRQGLLRVAFPDGGEVTCPIGAAASQGQGQDWSFIANRRGCRAFADPRAMTLRIRPSASPPKSAP